MKLSNLVWDEPAMAISCPTGAPKIEFRTIEESGAVGMFSTQEMTSGTSVSQLIGIVDIAALRKLLDSADVK